VDGVPVNGTGVEGTGRPQGMIPLMDDRREHNVEVDLS
jgi:cyclic beta-1,2-glucan synthetase